MARARSFFVKVDFSAVGVIDSLGVLAIIGILRKHPALRKDVPDGAGKRFEAFSRAHGGQSDDVIEE